MNLSETCIKRPVFTIVISLILLLVGLMSLRQLSLRADPKLFRPRLYISITLPGSSAEYIEKNITTPLEASLRAVSNVSMMESTSQQNSAGISLHFKNISQQTFVTIESQVNQAVTMARLPQTATVRVFAGGHNDTQIMFIGLHAKGMSTVRLSDYVNNTLVNDFQEVPGVGQVNAWMPKNALRVNLNAKKMALLGVSAEEVINALQANDISVQAGEIMNKEQILPLNIISKSASVEQFRNVIIKKINNRVIRLRDVSVVEVASASFSGSFTYFNGQPGAMITISAADDANPIATGDRVHEKLALLKKSLPPGVSMHVVFDMSVILKHSVKELYMTIFEAVFFVALVTFLFLGRLQFTFVPVITIPVCIISAFSFVWLLGFSINLMTLLALVLAVGLVVDDAIVVLENCYRHVELGLSPMKAALQSMREVTFPVIGMTVSIIAVYLPTAFMKGKTAVYFQQFAFTLAGAVLISGVVALTLTPMMCARLNLADGNVDSKGYAAWIDLLFERFKVVYASMLSWVLRFRFIAMIVFIVLFSSGAYYYKLLPRSLLPKEYAGFAFMGVRSADTASTTYIKKQLQPVLKTALSLPEINFMMSFGGGARDSGGMSFNMIKFKSAYSSSKATLAAAHHLQSAFAHWISPQVFVQPIDINSHGSGGNSSNLAAVSFYLQGYVPYDRLSTAATALTIALNKTGMFSQANNGLRYTKQQYNIEVNRELANQLQVPVATINNSLQYFFGGYTISNGFDFGGVLYPVIVQLPAKDLTDLSILKSLFVQNALGDNIQLSRLVTVTPGIGLPQRNHLNGARAAEIDVVAKDQYSTGQVLDKIEQVAKTVLPSGVSLGFSQHFLDMIRGNDTMLIVFGLGLVFIYLILSALFESFVDPFIILFTVPLCIVGAIIVLHLIGGSVNIYTSIGFVTLIGLVSKHGVLITHFANDMRHQGMTSKEAVIKAASIRLRPILMTTATMVMGALPLVLSAGVGSNGRAQVGTVIIAGLLVGTLFSLFIVPVAYSLLRRFSHKED